MTITEVDPFDDAAFDDWHATYAAAEQHGRGEWSSVWWLEESRAAKQARLPSHEVHVYALSAGGQTVAVAELELPMLDNQESAFGMVHTHPEHRNRGHGSALLAHLEGIVTRRGRKRFITEAAYPWEAPVDGAGHPYADFLTRRGFTCGIGDVQRVLALPVADEVLVDLAAEAAPHHTAYQLRSFAGQVPEEHVADYAALSAAVSTEAPTGEMEIEPETADVEAFRAQERLQVRQGRTRHATVAVAPDGSLAGYTDLVTSEHDPGRAYQWGTLVWPQHRGHRLGVALKVANVRQLQHGRPDIKVVRTWNAEVNAPMVAVNQALGFRPVERLGEFQKTLTAP